MELSLILLESSGPGDQSEDVNYCVDAEEDIVYNHNQWHHCILSYEESDRLKFC